MPQIILRFFINDISIAITSPCNSVRVVLLIARGWRGTSLPRGIRKETATPMALFPTQHTLTQGSLHYRLATLGYQKRNTDGVETFIL